MCGGVADSLYYRQPAVFEPTGLAISTFPPRPAPEASSTIVALYGVQTERHRGSRL
jgi:hypothetical protein